MDLGTFSISLTVADLGVSRAFYEGIGFEVFDGDEQTWLMMRNDATKVGLFQGMFDHNILTFNPPDARAVEASLIESGSQPVSRTEGATGPTNFIVLDPDGNTLMFDQHD